MSLLLSPFTLGPLSLPNRIVMSPLTRARAGASRIPNDLMAQYYAQRASAGLILTEATVVSPQAIGYADTPGIWSVEQTEGWKKTTSAVHARGGRIFSQLWHCGRISHPMFLNGGWPVAPSAVQPRGHVSLVRPKTPFPTPRALSLEEVKGTIADFRRGAANALRAGFDGVELHAANGYLIDQFLQTSTNKRTDDYGGPVENRARLLLEIADALVSVWGPERVGIHLAPRGDAHDMGDDDPQATFTYAARELGRRRLAFIFLRDRQGPGYLTPVLKKEFGGTVIANQGLTPPLAEKLLREGAADLASFGTLYISNPDLVERVRAHVPLVPPDPATMYGGGAQGYVDYPAFDATAAA